MRQESCPKIWYISAPRLGKKFSISFSHEISGYFPWFNGHGGMQWNAPVLKISKPTTWWCRSTMINPLRSRLPRSHKTKPWRSANGFGDEIGVYHGLSLSHLMQSQTKLSIVKTGTGRGLILWVLLCLCWKAVCDIRSDSEKLNASCFFLHVSHHSSLRLT